METEKISLKGKVIWFYGLSGAGKTTMSDLLAKALKEKGYKVERLDGDIVRKALCKDLGFSREDVFENIRRIAYVADILSNNGITVIASFITPHQANRIYLEEKLGNKLILIYLSASIRTCMKRDKKGLYEKAINGEIENLAGFNAPFDYKHDPHPLVYLLTDSSTVEDTYKALKGSLEWWDYEI